MWKSILGKDDNGNQLGDNILDDEEGFCSFSPLQRIYAFSACLGAGIVCMFLSYVAFARPIRFALLFSFGNILAVGSTIFLVGPRKQIKMMFDPVRVFATVAYVICVIFALVCALWMHSVILSILAVIFEILALLWYGLSYIPFARGMVSNMIRRVFNRES
nr:vesicle transport protein SFT2B [Ipomoea batatas]